MPDDKPQAPHKHLTGKISTKPRPFHEVVGDMRHIVFSIIRYRPLPDGQLSGQALGSGFFIKPDLFLTCHHVVNHKTNPHEENDQYQLVNNLGPGGRGYDVRPVVVGVNLLLFPECDAALLKLNPYDPQQAFAALDDREPETGKEIGVAGYPIPILGVKQDGSPRYDGLIYRVAKGVITASFETAVKDKDGSSIPPLGVIEVNFLFVPGNSGGPVFDALTGRVLGFVHGFRSHRVAESLSDTNLGSLPAGMSSKYIESVHAIYSLAIRLKCLQSALKEYQLSV